MTSQEAARELDKSDQTIAHWVQSGQLEGRDRGPGQRPRWLVKRTAVQRHRTGQILDQDSLRRRVAELEAENTRLRAELTQLKTYAQHLGIAAQAAVAAAQQALLPQFPPNTDL